MPAGRLCVGDGAVRYREVLEAAGAEVPPDDDPRHVPRAALHARLATAFGRSDAIEPIYVRAPDAEQWRPMMVELELRRLELGDLDAIERIERASYPTPWSRSMFASELAKPSSLSFGAVDESRGARRLPRPLPLRRRLARDERRRRAGAAP